MSREKRTPKPLPPWSRQIKELRQVKGLTQAGLAAELGIVKKIVAAWEQGASEPSPKRYIELAKLAYGEQALWFLGRLGLDRKFLGGLLSHPGDQGG